MTGSKSRNTPEHVARQLRQEAGFGCVMCGHLFVEYHHIVEWKDSQHFDPEKMVALCPTCHSRFHRMSPTLQYLKKSSPHNKMNDPPIVPMQVQSNLWNFSFGGNSFQNCQNIIAYMDENVLSWTFNGSEFLVRLIIRSSTNAISIEIRDNEIVSMDGDYWDLRFKWNFIELKSRDKAVGLRLDLRSPRPEIKFSTFLGGHRLVIDESNIGISGKKMKNTGNRFARLPGYCYLFKNGRDEPIVNCGANGIVLTAN